MMAQKINRRQVKADVRQILRQADVPANRMLLIFLLLQLGLNVLGTLGSSLSIPMASTFLNILVLLMNLVLTTGYTLYCMAVLRGERAEYMTIFDGFSFVGRLIVLSLVEYLYIGAWSILFVIPGIIAAYRYRFALYNLCEDPEMGIFEALEMSKRQTMGYKLQLMLLDLSYLPWLIVASIPTVLLDLNYFMGQMPEVLGSPFLPAIPDLAATLITGIWTTAAAFGYYASMTCADLEYFRIAKETSGISVSSRPQLDSHHDNSDET